MRILFSFLLMFASANIAIAASIRDGAYEPITKASSPKLFKAWGKEGIARINAAVEAAVKLTAKSEKCDEVFLSGYSFDRSEPRDHFEVFTQCSNGEKFYFSEQQAISPASDPEAESDWIAKTTDSEALRACENLAKTQVQFPSTMDVSILNSTVDKTQYGVNVALAFEAKNGFGAMLPYLATCSLDKTKVHLRSIKSR